MEHKMESKHLQKFYDKTPAERITALKSAGILDEEATANLQAGLRLPQEIADNMIENQLSTYDLPYGVALNFLIDGKEYAVPMAIEEPSVIAAASAGAKLIAKAGGFRTTIQERIMIGQVALKNVPDSVAAEQLILSHQEEILKVANAAHPSIVKRGGGARRVSARILLADDVEGIPSFFVVHLHVETLEAMGANIINTMMEGVIPYLESLTGGEALMGILTNYATDCLATAECRIPAALLTKGVYSGEEVRDRLIEAYQFAYVDPYRAVTNNKGIMNGIDAIVLASGNDWRAISAGAHAYASHSGQYRSLTTWKKAENGDLLGSLTLPLPIGAVGGSINFHPAAKMTKEILGYQSAAELESIIVSVGLAQNFSAIKALVTEGIQKGHMGLHSRSLAISAGATGDEIEQLSARLKAEKNMNLATAQDLLERIRKS
ncbi:hydroxymethylglutaryl-CoA reductase, degradative [Trichococcus patagoniensis]|nr:hydroxymethylglutaryl-CoA reductase, degradative [Trichococcus patagoniensis]